MACKTQLENNGIKGEEAILEELQDIYERNVDSDFDPDQEHILVNDEQSSLAIDSPSSKSQWNLGDFGSQSYTIKNIKSKQPMLREWDKLSEVDWKSNIKSFNPNPKSSQSSEEEEETYSLGQNAKEYQNEVEQIEKEKREELDQEQKRKNETIKKQKEEKARKLEALKKLSDRIQVFIAFLVTYY